MYEFIAVWSTTIVIKIEKDDYVDGDSQCPMLQSGQEGSLLIDKEEKVVFQRSDGFKIYFIKQEPKEEVCHQQTGPCSRGDMALEQSSLQQWTLEAQPREETEVVDPKQDSVKEAEGVQAASQVSSGGCINVVKESRQRNSEHGRSKHAKLPSNVGMGKIKAEEITESEEGSEANVAPSSKSDVAIAQVEVPVPRTYACPMCSQRFSKRYHLKEHKYRIHSGERPYECPQCQEGFVRLRDLEYHFKIRHRSIYKTTCECGDILTDKQLDGHRRTCRGKKLNQCAQCENQIPGGMDLTQLKTVHDAERPYCSGYVKILPLNAALSIRCETKQPNVNPHDCLNSTRQGLSNSENGIKNSLEQGLSLSVPVGGIDREELNENRQKSVPVNDKRLSKSENGASCTENAKLINDVPESNLTARECEAEEGKESSIILPSGSNTIRLGKGVFKPFACSECNQGFYHQSWLVDHLRRHHAGIYNRLGL
ncbi:zinc finger protein 551-like [Strongylocentrotus purpuratus]|uniref:C2H2-type domain-containing protein n=1 Tax=Strongylocentrotus purpuratus TaxID=7668 RepID=A0A7M7NC30_STRPU|nr:zinc finger protein 551-like [Strongylocentrotus purpuratus]